MPLSSMAEDKESLNSLLFNSLEHSNPNPSQFRPSFSQSLLGFQFDMANNGCSLDNDSGNAPYFQAPPPAHQSSSRTATVGVQMEVGDVAGSSLADIQSVLPFEMSNSVWASNGLPPRNAHRRSLSEIPFGFMKHSSLPIVDCTPLSLQPQGGMKENIVFSKQNGPQPMKKNWTQDLASSGEGRGDRKVEVDDGDDLFSVFMNWDGLDALNSLGTEDKREELDTVASGMRTNWVDGSENESESSINKNGSNMQTLQQRSCGALAQMEDGTKRRASGHLDLRARSSRHCRSLSMDSVIGRMKFTGGTSNLLPSPGFQFFQHHLSCSLNETSNIFSEFTVAEMKKIMANEKLTEIAMSDPKRVKRILANRLSAARSKERKMKYMSELELRVQTLQTKTTTLNAQLSLLQKDSTRLKTENNELKFRFQAMEQQAQLRDALNEALTAEVLHLKLATEKLGEDHSSNCFNQQLSMNSGVFQLQQQH